jgi:hypothetical protein
MPTGLTRFRSGLALHIDLNAVDLDIAGGDHRGDAAIALDLGDQPRRTESRNPPASARAPTPASTARGRARTIRRSGSSRASGQKGLHQAFNRQKL